MKRVEPKGAPHARPLMVRRGVLSFAWVLVLRISISRVRAGIEVDIIKWWGEGLGWLVVLFFVSVCL